MKIFYQRWNALIIIHLIIISKIVIYYNYPNNMFTIFKNNYNWAFR